MHRAWPANAVSATWCRRRITLPPPAAISANDYYKSQPLPRLNPDGTVSLAQQQPTTPSNRMSIGSPASLSSLDGATDLTLASSSGSTALATLPDTVQVTFTVPQYVGHYGQILKVVGALEELGAWAPEKVRSVQRVGDLGASEPGWCASCCTAGTLSHTPANTPHPHLTPRTHTPRTGTCNGVE